MKAAKAFPEAQWKFRRWYVWGVTGANTILLGMAILNGAIAAAYWAIGAVEFWIVTLYLGGPTGEQITRMLQIGKVMRAALERGASYGEVMSVPPDEVG